MIETPRFETLADLRVEIDRIDAALHEFLIKRGEIIHRLIEAKARQGGGLAFRPAREADMMRALIARHHGLLPLDTVEGIWRIIISTFTFVQSSYSVHADISGGDAAMRDCCRFHFGFTVPYVPQADAAGVVEAVAASHGDLGLVRVASQQKPWWRALSDPAAPKVIARLPFVERPDHPAGLPVFVIAKPLAEAAVRDIVLYDVSTSGDDVSLGPQLEILGRSPLKEEVSLLVAAKPDAAEAWQTAIAAAGAGTPRIVEIGGHAARCDASELQRDAAQ
ncbi:MAG TPA: chorismate mutase [Methylocella sp.]|nr:chorismate mutase [Methylocella sp.]